MTVPTGYSARFVARPTGDNPDRLLGRGHLPPGLRRGGAGRPSAPAPPFLPRLGGAGLDHVPPTVCPRRLSGHHVGMSERYDHRDADTRAQDATTEEETVGAPVMDGADDLRKNAEQAIADEDLDESSEG
jgi:hypothetical protein